MQIYEQTPKANSEKSYCRGGSGIIIIIVIYSLHDDNFSLFFWIFLHQNNKTVQPKADVYHTSHRLTIVKVLFCSACFWSKGNIHWRNKKLEQLDESV